MIFGANMNIYEFQSKWSHAEIQKPNGDIFIRLIGEHGSYIYANSFKLDKWSKEFVMLYKRDFRNNIDIPIATLNVNDIDEIYSPFTDEDDQENNKP